MIVRRKFNLVDLGKKYESIDIEIEGDNIYEIMGKINSAWKTYSNAIKNGKAE